MSRLTRALVVGVMVMAMSLATTAAVAQTHTHNEHTTGEREAAQRWNDYYHATRLAPAEHKASTQAGERSSDPTKATAPPRPDAPIGELGWLVIILGVLTALVAGLAVLAARFSGGGAPARPAV
jgi:urease accessory protein UreF